MCNILFEKWHPLSIAGCETEKRRQLIPDSLLSLVYDSSDQRILLIYNDIEMKVGNTLVIDESYGIKIQQERKSTGDYVLSVEMDGNKIYDEFNPTPYLLPSANVYFGYGTSLERGASETKIENVSIIKGKNQLLLLSLEFY